MTALRTAVALLAAGIAAACDGTPVDQPVHDPQFHRERPIGAFQTEGFGRGRPLIFDYTQNFFCPQSAATAVGDLPCTVGVTPAVPNALDLEPDDIPDLVVIVPFFDKDGLGGPGLGALEAFDPTPAVDVQCPEPGEAFSTCTLHPGTLTLAPAVAGALGLPAVATPIPLPNHSHVVRETPGGSVPWDIFVALVTDPAIWPDKDGACTDAGDCLTSIEAVQKAVANGQVFAGTVPSDLILFFGVHNLR